MSPQVGIYIPESPRLHVDALNAMTLGLRRKGVDSFSAPLEGEYVTCDILITFGIGKLRTERGQHVQRIIDAHAEAQGIHLVIERGFIHRDRYFMVGWNGLNGRANYCNDGMPHDRWDELSVTVKPWRTSGHHILLCGQVPWDSSVQHTDHALWCHDVVRRLVDLTDRPIRFRPHPLAPNAIDLSMTQVEISTRPSILDDFEDCWAVITFSSNAGVEASIEGIPAFAMDEGAMGFSILNRELENIELPNLPDRSQWLANLAYTQWTLEEIADGKAWEHLWENQPGQWLKWLQGHDVGRPQKAA